MAAAVRRLIAPALAIGLRGTMQRLRGGTFGMVLFAGGAQQMLRDAADATRRPRSVLELGHQFQRAVPFDAAEADRLACAAMPSWLPLLAVSTFFLLGIGMRSWLQRRRHGTWGIVLFRGDAQQKVRDGGLLLLFATLLAQAIVVWHYDIDPADLDMSLPNADSWPWTGAVLAFGGIAVLVTAQLQLGASWRIGIDEHARPGLVEVGIYRWSRNPIFSGLLLFLLGHLLLVPTWLSLLQLVLATIGINLQVRAEERWLLRTYGDEYRSYANRVGRFAPWPGRLHRN